eukprot:1136282-Pelagomonas_calceolata.AAC.3
MHIHKGGQPCHVCCAGGATDTLENSSVNRSAHTWLPAAWCVAHCRECSDGGGLLPSTCAARAESCIAAKAAAAAGACGALN